MNRVFLHPAYVLHTRSYRNTSLLVDFYTRGYGRLGAVARGVRASRKNPARALLQPFIPLLVSWQKGRSDLVTLIQVEGDTGAGRTTLRLTLQGSSLLAGLYVNELMVRLIKGGDPSNELFLIYQQVLGSLSNTRFHERDLRIFEKRLLAVLGYGVTFHRDQFGHPIDPTAHYFYEPQKGFKRVITLLPTFEKEGSGGIFRGSSLFSFGKEALADFQSLQDAKHLMRQILAWHLGDKPLQSRKLFLK